MSLQDKITNAKPTTFLTDGLTLEEVKQAVDEGRKRSMNDTIKLIVDIPEEVLDYLQPFKEICYQKIEEGTDSEHEHMLKALYEGVPLDSVKAEIVSMEYHMIDCEVLVSQERVLEILDDIGKESEK